MAIQYYIGHSDTGIGSQTLYVPGYENGKWSTNASRAKFNFTIVNGYFYYSNLVGTIANGQTVFALCTDTSPRPDLPIGVISELNTSTKRFYVSSFAATRVVQDPNYVMCSGFPTGVYPASYDTIILDDKTGPLPSVPSYISGNYIYYTKVDCTGFSGTIKSGMLRTRELILSTTTKVDSSRIFYLADSSNLKFGIVGSTPIPTNDLDYNYDVVVLAEGSPKTLTLTSNVINKQLALDCIGYDASIALETANFNIDVDNLSVVGNVNAGTSSIIAKLLSLNYESPEYSNNTSLSNIKAKTAYGNFTCNTFTAYTEASQFISGLATISATTFNLDNADISNLSFIKLNGGTVQIKNSSFSDVTALPINTFYASNSINNGGNTNINFSTNSIMTFF